MTIVLLTVIYVVAHKIYFHVLIRDKSDFESYFLYKATNKSNLGFMDKLLIIWCISKFKESHDTKHICQLAKLSIRKIANIVFKNKMLVLVFESAVWENELELVEWCMNKKSHLHSSYADYFDVLYAWKIEKNIEVAIKLTSPVVAYDYQIPFVYYYAKAQILESKENYHDALKNYQIALETLPPQSNSYKKAVDSCNYIRNRES